MKLCSYVELTRAIGNAIHLRDKSQTHIEQLQKHYFNVLPYKFFAKLVEKSVSSTELFYHWYRWSAGCSFLLFEIFSGSLFKTNELTNELPTSKVLGRPFITFCANLFTELAAIQMYNFSLFFQRQSCTEPKSRWKSNFASFFPPCYKLLESFACKYQ